MKKIDTEIKRRRTFAIISHPDAGKTTLTEKLLLYGGAINQAGAVKSNKIKKSTVSDFMEIERQRGISVATSVMGFEYLGKKINILDTPGHKDFAEDTYRTLTAADSVIVVIDVAKGVEIQTEKLVRVCKMRNTPIIVFINKLDREGKDPFDLLDEIEQKLEINVKPMSWPIGIGNNFKGIYNIYNKSLLFYDPNFTKKVNNSITIKNLFEKDLKIKIDKEQINILREDIELIESVYDKFDSKKYLSGDLSPIFFGSALNTFGVQELLDSFIKISPYPLPRESQNRKVYPNEEKFSGFIFKIHANMDPKHRDRIAFLKVVSGIFKRNYSYKHVRLNKNIKFSTPTAFMSSKKSIIEYAYPGDIVGIHDTGNFKIGDSVTEGEFIKFKGIPSFSPELFRFIVNTDPMKSKQLSKGISQLMDEGVAQLFTMVSSGRKLIGTVGPLQFDVIQFRLKHEYGAACDYENFDIYKACWVSSKNKNTIKEFKKFKYRSIAEDKFGRLVFMADSEFAIRIARDKFEDINFHFTSEF